MRRLFLLPQLFVRYEFSSGWRSKPPVFCTMSSTTKRVPEHVDASGEAATVSIHKRVYGSTLAESRNVASGINGESLGGSGKSSSRLPLTVGGPVTSGREGLTVETSEQRRPRGGDSGQSDLRDDFASVDHEIRGAAKGKAGKGTSNPKTRKGNGKAPCEISGKSKVSRQDQIQSGLNIYRSTKWYREAVVKGFKNKTALDRFNAHVETLSDEIDPTAYPVCTDCGHSDLRLCDCMLVVSPTAVHVEGDALIIPSGSVNTIWRFDWVDRVRRMFIRPHFNIDTDINHNIGWLSNTQLSEDDYLWPEMLSFIRLRMNVTYVINGRDDRMARLAHCNKLALLFLDTMKIKTKEQLNPAMVNRVLYTVKKACDQVDNQFLHAESNEDHSIFRAVPWASVLKWGLIAGAITSPILVSKLANVSMRTTFRIWSRLAQTNALILADGSVQAFRFALNHLRYTVSALLANIWNGIVRPFSIGTLQSLCNIAGITYTAASNSGISRLP